MNYVWLGLMGGVLAFTHCLGMCGGFALHLSRDQNRLKVVQRELLWIVGKLVTYMFLGAVAGFIGNRFGLLGATSRIQDLLTYIVGGVIVLMGFVLLGWIPSHRQTQSSTETEGFLSSMFRQFFSQPTSGGAFVLGLATGFLPCPIVLGFLALSLHSQSVLIGMATMAALGVGTAWSLLLLGVTGHVITFQLKRWSTAVGGTVLILLGAATIGRGTDMFHHLLGCAKAVHAQHATLTPTCGPTEPPAEHPCRCHKQSGKSAESDREPSGK